ncbi:MAG: cobyric acid synthase CobQ, partial [Dehalococcoidia bacterium]|nr:cobyric acid synthase CobQ [Dehalococcoidia bacterium]
GLGLLDVETVFEPEKRTVQGRARVNADSGLMRGLRGRELEGYEIHMGRTQIVKGSPALIVYHTPEGDKPYYDGCISESGSVLGTYLHGLFNNEDFTAGLLAGLSGTGREFESRDTVSWRQAEYDRLASIVRENLDMRAVYGIVESGVGR